MNTALIMKPIPIVNVITVSFRIAALIKNVIKAAHINKTRSIGGILSVMPAITARKVGISDDMMKTNPSQPIDSAVLGFSLLFRKSFKKSLKLDNLSNQLTFVEDVSSNFCDPFSFPSWVDVVCMIV